MTTEETDETEKYKMRKLQTRSNLVKKACKLTP